MNILCFMFGHRPRFGYCHEEGAGYFRVELCEVDGTGTQHASLYCDCERCGVNYHVGRIHVPPIERMPYDTK
jgi:hypothetical protein